MNVVYLEAATHTFLPSISALHADNHTAQTPAASQDQLEEQSDVDLPNFIVDLDAQREDEFFNDMINYIQDSIVPADRDRARSIIAQADFYQIEGNQLLKLATYKRKRQMEITPMMKQLCLPPGITHVSATANS